MSEFYNPAIEAYGLDDARALRWSSMLQQERRFEALCGVGDFSNASVLDVGCGFGDVYPFLRERYEGVRYLGIDINPVMIAAARRKYPDAAFEISDFGTWEGETRDFAIASGTFSLKIPDYRVVYFGYIKKMFDRTSVAVAFNMLDSRYHIDDEIFAAYLPHEIRVFAATLSAHVEVRDTYLRQDFTVYLYH